VIVLESATVWVCESATRTNTTAALRGKQRTHNRVRRQQVGRAASWTEGGVQSARRVVNNPHGRADATEGAEQSALRVDTAEVAEQLARRVDTEM
jgi:glutathione S-transferase